MRSRMCAALLLAALLAVLSACSKQPVRTDRTSPSTLEVASGQYLPAGALLSPGPDSNQTARAAVPARHGHPGSPTCPVCGLTPRHTARLPPPRALRLRRSQYAHSDTRGYFCRCRYARSDTRGHALRPPRHPQRRPDRCGAPRPRVLSRRAKRSIWRAGNS